MSRLAQVTAVFTAGRIVFTALGAVALGLVIGMLNLVTGKEEEF
jgi:hypothetical protein